MILKLIHTRSTGKIFHLHTRTKFFYSENDQSLEEPPQKCGGVSTTGGFPDATGQGAR